MTDRPLPVRHHKRGFRLPFALLIFVLFAACAWAPPATAAQQCSNPVHVVVKGDTIAALAGRYGVTVNEIVRANNLADANRIEIGQRLVMPSCKNGAQPRAGGPKRIEIDLSDQWMYAYEGQQLVLSAGTSTGKKGWETPVGSFKVYSKVPLQTMRGSAKGEKWEVPDVPHIMYFYRNVALHGAYWHNRFGTGARLSHGCVNLPLAAAQQLYNWASVGTPVIVRQ